MQREDVRCWMEDKLLLMEVTVCLESCEQSDAVARAEERAATARGIARTPQEHAVNRGPLYSRMLMVSCLCTCGTEATRTGRSTKHMWSREGRNRRPLPLTPSDQLRDSS